MSLITRLVLLALAVPFVLANGSGCGKDQFKWAAKDVCLPSGGPSKPPSPPANTDCPFNWSWHSGKGCCAPHQPPNTLPPPQCPKSWNWSSGSLCCKPPSTPPTNTKPSTPSNAPGKNYGHGGDDDGKGGHDDDGKDGHGDDDDGKDGHGGDDDGKDGHGGGDGKDGHGHRKRTNVNKRQNRSRNISPCPKSLSACPVSSLVGGEYECVDTLVDLDNCGGCSTLGEGQNCNAIPGVWNVGCEQSACRIYTCAEGYTLSKDGNSCNPL